MAISKVTLNGTTLMDATTATAAAGDVIAPKTAMLKNGVVTTGTGTTPTGTKQISITQNGTTTEDVAAYANAEITVDVQGGGGDVTKYINLIARSGTAFEDDTITTTGRGAFAYWTTLTTLNLPNLETIGDGCFQGCSNISKFFFPNVTSIAAPNAFNGAGTTTSTIVLPKLSSYPSINAINAFRGTAIDLGPTIDSINSYMFQNGSNLKTLILRKTSLAALNSINAFNGTPFASGKSGGTIYIPKVLYDHLGDGSALDYKAATNWSTIDGYGTITWAKIEGSIYETQYADGTPVT